MQKLQSLSVGAKVLGAALFVAFVSFFLPWWSASAGIYSTSQNVFTDWGWVYVLFWLATSAFFVMRTLGLNVNMPTLPLVDWQLYIIGGGVMVLGVFLFFLDTPSGSAFGVSVGVSFGWWVGLIAAAGVIAGGWLGRSDIA